MRRSLIVAVAVLAVAGTAFAWFWFSGGSGEPSTDLTTPPIAADSSTTAAATETSTTTAESTEPTTAGGAFAIQSDRSVATFTLNEVLRGEPKTVVGTTSEVAGQFVLDPSNLSLTSFSRMIVNARTFKTDSSSRDRAIRGPIILNSANDEFEFITFDVKSIEGLDGEADIGGELTFNLIGDLTIKGTTSEATFVVVATMGDDNTVTGTATAEVLRSDFDIGIPSISSVADVTDEVSIQLEFVATRTQTPPGSL